MYVSRGKLVQLAKRNFAKRLTYFSRLCPRIAPYLFKLQQCGDRVDFDQIILKAVTRPLKKSHRFRALQVRRRIISVKNKEHRVNFFAARLQFLKLDDRLFNLSPAASICDPEFACQFRETLTQ